MKTLMEPSSVVSGLDDDVGLGCCFLTGEKWVIWKSCGVFCIFSAEGCCGSGDAWRGEFGSLVGLV